MPENTEQVKVSLAEQNLELHKMAQFHQGESKMLRTVVFKESPEAKVLKTWASKLEKSEPQMAQWLMKFAQRMETAERFYRELKKVMA